MLSNGSLVISEFSSRDNRRYVCRAENSHGHVTHATDMLVYHGDKRTKNAINYSKALCVEINHGLEVINNTKASLKCTICPFKNFSFS